MKHTHFSFILLLKIVSLEHPMSSASKEHDDQFEAVYLASTPLFMDGDEDSTVELYSSLDGSEGIISSLDISYRRDHLQVQGDLLLEHANDRLNQLQCHAQRVSDRVDRLALRMNHLGQKRSMQSYRLRKTINMLNVTDMRQKQTGATAA
jgi:hypothetical protein